MSQRGLDLVTRESDQANKNIDGNKYTTVTCQIVIDLLPSPQWAFDRRYAAIITMPFDMNQAFHCKFRRSALHRVCSEQAAADFKAQWTNSPPAQNCIDSNQTNNACIMISLSVETWPIVFQATTFNAPSSLVSGS